MYNSYIGFGKEGSRMEENVFREMMELASQPSAVERSVEYLTEKLGCFLRKNERVLLLLEKKEDVCCNIMERAIRGCQAVPVWLGEDRRWITILKTAFTSKCNCIIGYPLLLLGLSKVARYMGIPLFARNVVMFGYVSSEWIVETLEKGLDCKVWGCYDPASSGIVTGFSCGWKGMGIHVRASEYGVDIVDEAGRRLADGEKGDMVLYPRSHPELRLHTGERARIATEPCPCGCKDLRLVEIDADLGQYSDLQEMGERLHYWSSVLDCRIIRREYGLDLEAIVFPGEKLPEFPCSAKMTIRPWNPEEDVPFSHYSVIKHRFTGFAE